MRVPVEKQMTTRNGCRALSLLVLISGLATHVGAGTGVALTSRERPFAWGPRAGAGPGGSPSSPVGPDDPDLHQEIERLLRQARGAEWSVLAVSLDRGDTLFAYEPLNARTPASNLKLFTSAAALYHLGPDFRFVTYLLTDGTIENGVLHGDLILYGTGDPTISDRFHNTKTTVLEQFAAELKAMGIRRIEGRVVGDASFFVGPEVGAGWSDSYLEDSFAAPASALSFNENIVSLHIRPGTSVGAPPRVTVIPEGALVDMLNNGQTVASPRGARLAVDRATATSPIVITGRISLGHGGVWRGVTVPDAALAAASVLRHVLVETGIEVAGPPVSVHDASESKVTGSTFFAPGLVDAGRIRVLGVYGSPPLTEILAVINKRSHNLYAELVLKTLGKIVGGEGSFTAGARVVTDFLVDVVGVEPSQFEVHDGSGLSPLNRASAGTFVAVLSFLSRSPRLWDPFWASLPEAGTSDGLRRMYRTAAANNVRAKTGTIERVSALSGYVRSGEGERIAFSILVNDAPSVSRAKRVEDQIAVRLATFRRDATVGSAVTAPDRTGGNGGLMHRVARGENLSVIASRYGVSLPALLTANANLDPRRLQVGQTVLIPSGTASATTPSIHEVRPGETLTALARRYGVTVSALLSANPGINARRLLVSQRIRIPATT